MRFSSSQTWAIVGFAALVWLALAWLGVTAEGDAGVVLRLADVIPTLLVLFAIHERWLWRWQPFHRLGISPDPVVCGTWRGKLQTHWKDPDTGVVPGPKAVYLAIHQTLTTIHVRLLTDESASDQVSGAISSDGFSPTIAYTYRNEPDLHLRGVRSEIHYGAAVLHVSGKPATELEGRYWTDRNSRGTFSFTEHNVRIAQTYAEAAKLEYGPATPAGPFTYWRAS
jgi:hypothetical protein